MLNIFNTDYLMMATITTGNGLTIAIQAPILKKGIMWFQAITRIHAFYHVWLEELILYVCDVV